MNSPAIRHSKKHRQSLSVVSMVLSCALINLLLYEKDIHYNFDFGFNTIICRYCDYR